MPQPGDIPGPQPSGDRQEVPAPEASDSPIGSAEPNGGRRTHSWRRRMGFAVVAVTVAVAGAAPFAWQALSESEGEKPKPGAEACRGPADTASKPNPEACSGPAGTAPAADFDSDGVQDTYATGESGGGVFVAYGRKGGADGDAGREECRRRLTLDSPGVPGKEGRGVAFGAHTVARDIDKDGYTDLVASVMSYRSDARSGLIALWGSSKGLSGGTYLKGMPKDYLGTGIGDDPLVAGEFTGDDDADLVVRVGTRQRYAVTGPSPQACMRSSALLARRYGRCSVCFRAACRPRARGTSRRHPGSPIPAAANGFRGRLVRLELPLRAWDPLRTGPESPSGQARTGQ